MPKSDSREVHKAVAKLLKQARVDAKLTQLELAAKLKRPQSFVAKYEGAERRLDIVELIQIARVLSVSQRTLLAAVERLVQ